MGYTQYAIAKKISELEEELKSICIKNNTSEIDGFTIMTDSESGFTILYKRDMPIEETGGSREFYDRNSKYFDSENENIKWPYAGFVKGNILGWLPISVSEIIKLLEKYNYTVKDFVREFLSKKINNK